MATKLSDRPRKEIFASLMAPSPKGNGGDVLMSIIQPKVKDRWYVANNRSYPASTVDRITSQAETGQLSDLLKFYAKMEENSRIGKNLHEVRSDVAALNWTVKAYCKKGEKPTPEAQEKASFVEDCLFNMKSDPIVGRLNLNETIYGTCDSFGKGISMQEIDWRRNNRGEYVPMGTRWIGPQHLSYPLTGEETDRLKLSVSGTSYTDLIDIPDNKFITSIYRWRSGSNANRVGMLLGLAPFWCYFNNATEWLLQFAQIFGMPLRWGTYKAGGNDKQVMAEMLANIAAAGWACVPEGTQMNFVESSKNAGSMPQAWLMAYFDAMCDLVIKGENMTTQAPDAGGSRAQAQVTERSKSARVNHVAGWVGPVIQEQLIGPILRLNYGNETERPEFVARSQSFGQSAEEAAVLKALFVDMAIPTTQQHLNEILQLPEPKAGDVLYKPPMQQTGFTPLSPAIAGTTEQIEPTPAETVRAKAALQRLPEDLRKHYQAKLAAK